MGTPGVEKCRKCGRVLKNPKYVKIGLGPVCAKKLGFTGDFHIDEIEMIQSPARTLFEMCQQCKRLYISAPGGRECPNKDEIETIHSHEGKN